MEALKELEKAINGLESAREKMRKEAELEREKNRKRADVYLNASNALGFPIEALEILFDQLSRVGGNS